MESIHDWILESVAFDWESARVTVALRSHKQQRVLLADGVMDLKVPKVNAWGPSSSVNGTSEAIVDAKGSRHLKLEMQTGDVIEIVAREFTLT